MGNVPETCSRGPALGTYPGHFHGVRVDGEAVLGGEAGQPRVELARAELDDPVALGADEVVVMPFAAKAVADLVGMMLQRIDDAVLAEEGERPVDGRQTDRLSAAAQPCVDLLRGRVVGLRSERPEHCKALTRRP
jgi:hypothetical protein